MFLYKLVFITLHYSFLRIFSYGISWFTIATRFRGYICSFDANYSWYQEFLLISGFEKKISCSQGSNALCIDLRHSHVTQNFLPSSPSSNFCFAPNTSILIYPGILKNNGAKCFRCLNYLTMESLVFLDSQFDSFALRPDGFLALVRQFKLSLYKPLYENLRPSDVISFKNLYRLVSHFELDKVDPTLSSCATPPGSEICAISWDFSSYSKSILKVTLVSGSEHYLNVNLKPIHLSVALKSSNFCTYLDP